MASKNSRRTRQKTVKFSPLVKEITFSAPEHVGKTALKLGKPESVSVGILHQKVTKPPEQRSVFRSFLRMIGYKGEHSEPHPPKPPSSLETSDSEWLTEDEEEWIGVSESRPNPCYSTAPREKSARVNRGSRRGRSRVLSRQHPVTDDDEQWDDLQEATGYSGGGSRRPAGGSASSLSLSSSLNLKSGRSGRLGRQRALVVDVSDDYEELWEDVEKKDEEEEEKEGGDPEFSLIMSSTSLMRRALLGKPWRIVSAVRKPKRMKRSSSTKLSVSSNSEQQLPIQSTSSLLSPELASSSIPTVIRPLRGSETKKDCGRGDEKIRAFSATANHPTADKYLLYGSATWIADPPPIAVRRRETENPIEYSLLKNVANATYQHDEQPGLISTSYKDDEAPVQTPSSAGQCRVPTVSTPVSPADAKKTGRISCSSLSSTAEVSPPHGQADPRLAYLLQHPLAATLFQNPAIAALIRQDTGVAEAILSGMWQHRLTPSPPPASASDFAQPTHPASSVTELPETAFCYNQITPPISFPVSMATNTEPVSVPVGSVQIQTPVIPFVAPSRVIPATTTAIPGPTTVFPFPAPTPAIPVPTNVIPAPTHVIPAPITETPAPTTVFSFSAPSHVIPGPTPVIPGPTPVIPASTHVIPAPTHVIPAPTHVIPAPTHVIPAPTHVIPAPTHVIPAPTHVIPAPTHVISAPITVTPAPTTVFPFPAPRHAIPAPTNIISTPAHVIPTPIHKIPAPITATPAPTTIFPFPVPTNVIPASITETPTPTTVFLFPTPTHVIPPTTHVIPATTNVIPATTTVIPGPTSIFSAPTLASAIPAPVLTSTTQFPPPTTSVFSPSIKPDANIDDVSGLKALKLHTWVDPDTPALISNMDSPFVPTGGPATPLSSFIFRPPEPEATWLESKVACASSAPQLPLIDLDGEDNLSERDFSQYLAEMQSEQEDAFSEGISRGQSPCALDNSLGDDKGRAAELVAEYWNRKRLEACQQDASFTAEAKEMVAAAATCPGSPPVTHEMKCSAVSMVDAMHVDLGHLQVTEDPYVMPKREVEIKMGKAGAGIVCFGGMTSNSAMTKTEACSRMLIFDEHSWHSTKGMPQPRYDSAACYFGDKIFVTGGCYTNRLTSSTCWIYCPASGQWVDGPPMIHRRRLHGMVTYGARLLAIGGAAGDSIMSAVECFDARHGEWRELASLPCAVAGMGAAVLEQRVYVCGGVVGMKGGHVTKVTDVVQIYNCKKGCWSVSERALQTRRALGDLVNVKGTLHLVGGIDSQHALRVRDSVMIYDKRENIWRHKYQLKRRRFKGRAIFKDPYLYVIGGEKEFKGPAMTHIEKLDCRNGQWCPLETLPYSITGFCLA